MARWTPEILEDLRTLSIRDFKIKHRQFTDPAVLIKRKELRDAGYELVASPIGRTPDPVVVHLPKLPEKPSDEQLWEAFDKMYAYQETLDASRAMPVAAVTVETDRPFGLVFLSDMHLGSKGVDSKRLREDIQLINACDHLQVYLGGDWTDNFVIQGLSNVHRDESLVTIDTQFRLFQSIMRQLLPSLMAVGSGNHDAWTKKVAGLDPRLEALADVPVLYTAEDTYLDITVGEQLYTVYRKHRPTRSSQYNDGHGVQHMFRFGERPFDVGVMEHHHTPHISTFWAHGQMRWSIRTGSYKIKDSHAREWGYHHGGVGTPVIVFYPHRKTIVPFMTIPEAIEFLEA